MAAHERVGEMNAQTIVPIIGLAVAIIMAVLYAADKFLQIVSNGKTTHIERK